MTCPCIDTCDIMQQTPAHLYSQPNNRNHKNLDLEETISMTLKISITISYNHVCPNLDPVIKNPLIKHPI